MVRRRSSLIRGSHASVDDHPEHVAVINGIRASFVTPQHRHSALLALYEENASHYEHPIRQRYETEAPSARRQSSLLTLYNKNPKRYSWARPAMLGGSSEDSSGYEHQRLQQKPIVGYGGLDLSQDVITIDNNEVVATTKKQVWKARVFLIVCAVLYGTSFPLIKILDDSGMPVGISLTMRFGLAAAVTFPWLVEVPAVDWDTSYHAVLSGMEVGMWDAIGFLSQAMGMVTEKSNKTAFLCSLDVIVVPILDRFEGQSFEFMHMVAAGMAVLGVGLLELDEGSINFSVGDLWSLIQPIAFGVGFWRTEHVVAQYPDEANRITAAQLFSCFLLSALYITISSLLNPEDFPTSSEFTDWFTSPALVLSLVWTGIMTMALTVYLETVAMQTASAAETTLLMSSEPFWAALFAWILVGESLGVLGILGGTLIVGACVTDMW